MDSVLPIVQVVYGEDTWLDARAGVEAAPGHVLVIPRAGHHTVSHPCPPQMHP
jgi:diadenosine tetraphosphate (Ap4A) HIT family hydrolase